MSAVRRNPMNIADHSSAMPSVITPWLLAIGLLAIGRATVIGADANLEMDTQDICGEVPTAPTRMDPFDYQCFGNGRDKANEVTTNLNMFQIPIALQVSDRVTHQLLTRIFAIFLKEKLNYHNVSLVPVEFDCHTSQDNYEYLKTEYILNSLKYFYRPDMTVINLEVWLSSVMHSFMPASVQNAGSSITTGRFGWFVPIVDDSPTNNISSIYNNEYAIFLDPNRIEYQQYVINEKILNKLRNGTSYEDEFISPRCRDRRCVTLLAEHYPDTFFVKDQILESNSYVNVLWLGGRFREKISWLHKLYRTNENYKSQNFIVLHWTPSDVIEGLLKIKFRQLVLPRCEDLQSLQNSSCKYEFTPLLKLFSKSNLDGSDRRVLHALRMFVITDGALNDLFKDLRSRSIKAGREFLFSEDIYNEVACNWLKNNSKTYERWISTEPKINLSIGGIFPITETSRGHQNLVNAVRLAVSAINRNRTILSKYNLEVLENDGQCKADVVMKAFIHYFNIPKVLGVLGPACSETVEPIAGISKHMNMAVISYSAEGASFMDRKTYPYFFRTIGSNRQYELFYISIMKRLEWKRVAALTEDGQKYTEYIAHMEASMKQQDLEMIINKKFLSDVTSAEMNKHLVDLKKRHAKIIIADIHNRNAELALCEAYKLGMTAYDGYVWFLPIWLSKDWDTISRRSNGSCSSQQLQMAFEGHFSLIHAPFGEDNATMQESITVGEWLKSFRGDQKNVSNYVGFAYDAVWAYALAADKLLRENPYAVNNLRSGAVIERFAELIWQTDFNGLSGRVRFGEGGSRITDLTLMQWRNTSYVPVGQYLASVHGRGSNLHTNDGVLELREQDLVWYSDGMRPDDGTFDCTFSSLAQFLGVYCESVTVIVTALLCLLAVMIVSLVSFLFWKQRYKTKLKESAKIMRNFGIDLLTPSRSQANTLDKWEVPKEMVVINRRLGEGAFGTVYGGEAHFENEGWTAVAVKTLKVGASKEDRLDFLTEAEAMKRFDHKNIVRLLGVCLQSEPIYTIMEFMLYGDLKTYLLARRHLVNEKQNDESDISPKRLTSYAMDVARGLAYLAEQKFVHRDIACRNCLVDAQRVVKIGDFGMARPTFESDYYRFNRKGMLPVRWMAPESLGLGMFTPSSDVWAFGVVVYEIITFGSYPYQGMTNNQVMDYVKNGHTIEVPAGVKPHLEGLIKACWSQDPKKRPTAAEIVDHISKSPNLLSPCLDFPGASVEMPETESDQLELLPKLRKCSPMKRDSTLDILSATLNLNEFDGQMNLHRSIDMPEEENVQAVTPEKLRIVTPPLNLDTFPPTTPDGYSVMAPLLMYQAGEVNSDSSQSQMRLLKKSPSEVTQQTPF